MGIRIVSTGAYLPDKVITNEDLSKIMDTSNEWIMQRTGIMERRVALDEDCSDIAVKAGKMAIDRTNISSKDIDLIIVATCTPDYFCPSVACIVQEKLGADNAVSFDISAACTGFIFALKTAESLLNSNNYNNALIIGSEVMTKLINFNNRNTGVLFGDGAGAVVISKNNSNNGIQDVFIKTDGKGSDLITMPAFSTLSTANFNDNKFIYKNNISRDIHMEGREVFKFATSIMEKMIKDIIFQNNLSLEDIKYIVPHQANSRIIDYVARKLKLDNNAFYTNIEKYANTSAASIPIALNEMNEKGLIENGDNIILLGFGGGLSFGSALIKW